jgi:hypothetical protein
VPLLLILVMGVPRGETGHEPVDFMTGFVSGSFNPQLEGIVLKQRVGA